MNKPHLRMRYNGAWWWIQKGDRQTDRFRVSRFAVYDAQVNRFPNQADKQ